jgi:hypothetical protein
VSVRFYMDEHVPARITAGLRRLGVDCLTGVEDGTTGWPDDRLLQRATELGRVLYTNDVDFLAITADWLTAGREFAGVIYSRQFGMVGIGRAMFDLELVAKASEPGEWVNRVGHIPL